MRTHLIHNSGEWMDMEAEADAERCMWTRVSKLGSRHPCPPPLSAAASPGVCLF
jgi:hypothetical protein